MLYKIAIKTNSSYNYLWNIINDQAKCFDNIILFCDDTMGFDFNDNIEIVNYDRNKTYTKRLVDCFSKLDCEFVLLIHDIDLILNFSIDKFKQIMDIVKRTQIDRLSLGVFNSIDSTTNISEEAVHLCKLYPKMSKNFFTPFDYAPSVYNRKKVIEFYSNFPDERYQTLELNPSVQEYIFRNFKSYGISNKKIDLVYHRGFVYSKDFNFIHITIQGKFFSPESYFDLREDFEKIKNRYNLNLQYADTRFIEKNELL